MIDFAAIDFETANGNATSVCSVGVVIVREGKTAEKFYRLIRPVPNYYSRRNIIIHGLTYEDTRLAAPFPSVWAEIAPSLAGLPLVAHYSRFDEGCLRAVHLCYGMEYPGYTFYCTCMASRRVFGKRLPDHRLSTVAAHCGYDLRRHHHALADAEACAWIAARVFRQEKSGGPPYLNS